MKASILKRLEALEAAATAVTARPIVLIDITKLPDADRDAFWSGDDMVLTRYGLPDGPVAPGRVHTLVISIHPETREAWVSTVDLDDDDLDEYEQRMIREEERRERKAREREQSEKIQLTRVHLPPAPANAYSPEYDRD